MHLNSLGSAAMGFSAVSIDGSPVAALSAYAAGNPSGPCWLTDTAIIYQDWGIGGGGPYTVESYDTGTTTRTTRDSQGANVIAAGGGTWAAWLGDPTVGVRTNLSGVGPFPLGAVGDVSNDGEFCLINAYPAVTGLTVYSAAGATLLSLPSVVLAQNFVRLKDHLLLYRDASGWIMTNVIGGAFAFRPRLDPIFWIVPVTTASGKTFVVEVSHDTITLRYADRADGWQLQPTGTNTFNPDVIEVSPGVLRIGWSATSGEGAADLVLMDVTLATGATSVGTVVGGVIVWTTGTPLTLTTFPVGPLQGSNTGGSVYPPIKDPVVDERRIMTRSWTLYEQNVRTNLSGLQTQIDVLPPSVPPPPGFGAVAGGLGGPVLATQPNDTLTLTSPDGSILITENPVAKTVSLRTVATAQSGRGVPGRTGDRGRMGMPGRIGVDGAPGATGPQGPMGPPPRRADDVTRVVLIGSQSSAAPSTDGNWIPLSLGVEPLTFVSDGAGQPILTWFTP